jgi:hypothetical protein
MASFFVEKVQWVTSNSVKAKSQDMPMPSEAQCESTLNV